MEHAIEHAAGRALLAGQGEGVLDLVHDLAFAQHHRIKPAGHAEEMPAGLLAVQLVEVWLECVHRQIARCAMKLSTSLTVGESRSLATSISTRLHVLKMAASHWEAIAEQHQRRRHAFAAEGELLADLDRSGAMIQADQTGCS